MGFTKILAVSAKSVVAVDQLTFLKVVFDYSACCSLSTRESEVEAMEDVSVQQVDRLLKLWSQNITEQTKEIIASALGKYPEAVNGANAQTIIDDVKDRQSRVISVSLYLFLLNDCRSNLLRILDNSRSTQSTT